MTLCPQTCDAFIFDLDGTLADTMPAHYVAWRKALDPLGIPFPEEVFYGFGGVPTVKILEILSQRHGVPLDPKAIGAAKEAAFEEGIHAIQPISEVVEIARANFGKKPMAVATGGLRMPVARTLEILGITHWFGAIVTVEDVTHGKPHPETFALAAQKIGVDPRRCLAYEDADPGIASAKAAGMTVVDVRKLRAATC